MLCSYWFCWTLEDIQVDRVKQYQVVSGVCLDTHQRTVWLTCGEWDWTVYFLKSLDNSGKGISVELHTRYLDYIQNQQSGYRCEEVLFVIPSDWFRRDILFHHVVDVCLCNRLNVICHVWIFNEFCDPHPVSLYCGRAPESRTVWGGLWECREEVFSPVRFKVLTPLDFCLWSWMKSEVYIKNVDTRD
jgi:hypothetical protein